MAKSQFTSVASIKIQKCHINNTKWRRSALLFYVCRIKFIYTHNTLARSHLNNVCSRRVIKNSQHLFCHFHFLKWHNWLQQFLTSTYKNDDDKNCIEHMYGCVCVCVKLLSRAHSDCKISVNFFNKLQEWFFLFISRVNISTRV